MDGYLINGSIGMPRGSLLRIDDGAGVLVYVWEGELWLTQEGSRRDHVLQAGQWFRLDLGGAALVHAFRRSVVSLSASAPEAPARRITLQRGDSNAPAVLHRSGGSRTRRALRRLLDGIFAPRPAAAG
jgi:hypothetical protein